MRCALLLAALCLALAGPAAAQEKSRFVIVKPAPKAEAGLRGRISAPGRVTPPLAPSAPDAPADPPLAEPVGAAASVTWKAAPDRGAARQCRATCDRTYYFCLSGDDGGTCSNDWSQCRAKCEGRRG
jgi:hypothetical protein